MSTIIIELEYNYYLLECPAFVAENIKEYQQQFDAWMSDNSNDHGYWVSFEPESCFTEKSIPDPYDIGRDLNGKDALDYVEDAFVNWLNRFVLQDKTEKAKIIGAYHIEKRDEKGHAIYPDEYISYPHIFF